MHEDVSLVEVPPQQTAMNVLLWYWKRSPSSMPDFWCPWLFQMCIVYLITHCNLQTCPFFMTDCHMWFTSHMSDTHTHTSADCQSADDVNVSRWECGATSVRFLPHLEVRLPSKSFAWCCFCRPPSLPPPISCSPWRIGVSTYQRQNAYSTQSVRAATIY